jgi:predicted DCC family thiol-disulfide oxidoreductase YuxK
VQENIYNIILFDGECNFCNKTVQFIIARDTVNCFRFASLQSDLGRNMIEKFNLSDSMKSFILIEKGTAYYKSTAALRVAAKLSGFWKMLYLFIFIPPFLRDPFYNFIANNRHRIFPVSKTCSLPKSDLQRLFINKQDFE